MVEALSAPAVAIVGSRAASHYAKEIASSLAFDLGRLGLVVVSGMARGVDGAAHQGALEAGARTVAVLGCGVDVVYPVEHKNLAVSIARSGAVSSELPPGTPPLPHHFPLRNRIISGLSRAVVVIEAGEKSGSLITARCALEQGRDVMAVPGSALSGRNRGSHALLKDGAKLVEGVDDILEELGWLSSRPEQVADAKPLVHNGLLHQLQPGDTYGLDELAAMTGLSAQELLPKLLELELQGRLARLPGGRFVLVCKRV
jgi:DNA processing protein